jgi:hypothetical protein
MLTLEQLIDYYSNTNNSGLPVKLSKPVPPETHYVAINPLPLANPNISSNPDGIEDLYGVTREPSFFEKLNLNIYSPEPKRMKIFNLLKKTKS